MTFDTPSSSVVGGKLFNNLPEILQKDEACGSAAAPLDGAVATLKDTLLVQLSGNAAVIKPSEVSFHSAKVMEELLPLYLDKVHPFLCFLLLLPHLGSF